MRGAANGRAAPWKLRFWAVGNESWGCGGDMSAARYAEEFRRFGCFLRLHGETPLCKIACGADDDDYAWTDDDAAGEEGAALVGCDLTRPEYAARLDEELDLIESKGFTNYFHINFFPSNE